MLKQALIVAALFVGGLAQAGETKTVIMKSLSYDPKSIEIHAGDSLEWKNTSFTPHSATADDASFDTGTIAPKKTTKKVVFEKPGTFKYHCLIHGKTMSGEVVVK